MKKKLPLVVGNWKMNPNTVVAARRILDGLKKKATSLKNVELVIAPPSFFLSDLRSRYRGSKIGFGVQNFSGESQAAQTGEVSAEMAASVGATYAILGHSERRMMGETDEMVSKKVRAAFACGITPILCIGEKERTGEGAYLDIIRKQIEAVIRGLSPKEALNLVIAYEPVWAIGKKAEDAMRPHELYETVLFIRKVLTTHFGKDAAFLVRILYGGSVETSNVSMLAREGNVNGFLVGRASLDPNAFVEIGEAVTKKI